MLFRKKKIVDKDFRENEKKILIDNGLFPIFDDSDWDLFLPYTQHNHYSANDYVVKRHQTGQSLYIIFKGEIDIILPKSDDDNETESYHLATLHVGAIIGEVGFVDNKPRTANVRAKTDCELLSLDYRDFLKMEKKHFVVANKLLYELHQIINRRTRSRIRAVMGRKS